MQLKKHMSVAARMIFVLKHPDRRQPERERGWVSKATLVLMGSSKGWAGLGIIPKVVVEVVCEPLLGVDGDPAIVCSICST